LPHVRQVATTPTATVHDLTTAHPSGHDQCRTPPTVDPARSPRPHAARP